MKGWNVKRSTDVERGQRKLLTDLANGTLEHFKKGWPKYAKARGLAQMRQELQSIWKRYMAFGWNAPELKQPVDIDESANAFTDESSQERDEEERNEHLEKIILEGWLRRAKNPYQVEWRPKPRLRANVHSLEAMLSLALIRHGERLGFCGNPNCKRPYFFKARKDQRYCSAKCAEPAKREAKFRWHRANRWKDVWYKRHANPRRKTAKRNPR